MKNLTLIFVSLVFIVSACNSRKNNEFVINGNIEGNAPETVYLEKNIDGEFSTIDSAKVENGKFEFTGVIETPELYYIETGEGAFVGFFNEPANITIKFHTDSLQKPEVEGSVSDSEYRQYIKMMEAQRSALIGLYTQYNEASRNKDSVKLEELEQQIESIENDQKLELIKYIKSNSTSFVSPYITIRHAYNFSLEELKDIYASFDTEVKKSGSANKINERIAILENVAIGKPAPDFTMSDTEGNPVSLSSFKGKVILVDFWASWCGPCRRENPNVVRAFNKYKSQGFDVLGVSLDKEKDSWLNAISQDNLTWTHVSDLKYWNNEASRLYGVMSIPSNVLIDADGVIIARNLTGDDLLKKLEEVLSQETQPKS